jgi:hypothetical protein
MAPGFLKKYALLEKNISGLKDNLFCSSKCQVGTQGTSSNYLEKLPPAK